MKRDLELVRKILIFFEDRKSISIMNREDLEHEFVSPEYSFSEIAYHLRLMAQANLLACETVKSSTSDRIIGAWPFELTWDGHEFLQLCRDERVWNKMKRRAGDGFLNITFEVAKAMLIEELKRRVGLRV